VVLAVGLAMLVWTWGTWPDVLVDFGGEIGVAWRLSEGDALYRDLAYFTGPLSPYANSVVFRVFGASLRTLVLSNLVVLAAIAFLLHRIVARIAGALAAAAALVVFLTLFAFAQLEFIGNSNYVCPYSHETTHGALLSLLALAALDRWLASRRGVWIAAIGFLLGLVFLTKVEIFLALGAALLLGLAFGFAADRRGIGRSTALLAVCAAAPVAAAFLLLATAMDPALAWKGTLGAWVYVGDDRITSLAFYRGVMGTDRPRENAGKLLATAGQWLMLLGPAALAAIAWRRRGRAGGGALPLGIGAVLAASTLAALRLSPVAWIELGRPLPLFAGLSLCGTLIARFRARDEEARRRAVLACAFALFGLALLAKMALHARINMYGFALAMPAAMLLVAALVDWVPWLLERLGGRGALFRGVALGLLGVAIPAHLSIQAGFLSRKTVTVGEGSDAFRADGRGAYVNAAVEALRSKLSPGATLAVLPEGVMINYLLRARTPAKYINYMPPELLMFGQEAIVADFRRAPPDLVAVVHKSTAEYGLPWFGENYGGDLMAFVRESYAPGPLIGGEPLRPGTLFGIRLYALRR